MNREQFESHLSGFPLRFIRTKADYAENRKLPSFMDTYIEYFDAHQVPPSQETFVEYYFSVWNMERDSGIEARVRRAYASIVREHHLLYVLKEHFGDAVSHDAELDQKHGIDYVLTYEGKTFYIHAMLDTARSNYYRGLKVNRHKENNLTGVHVNMALNMKEAVECGDFFLYGEKQVQDLYEEMRKHL